VSSSLLNDDDDDDDDVMANGDSYNGRDTRANAEQLLANRFKVSYSFGLYINRLRSPFISFSVICFGSKTGPFLLATVIHIIIQ